TLELAMVRATVPEADPSAAGLAARIERLERLAGVNESLRTPEAGGIASAGQPPPNPGSSDTASPPAAPASSTPADGDGSAQHDDTPADTRAAEAPAAMPPESPEAEAAPHAPSTSTLDLQAIRRSWQQLLDRLLEHRKMILRANLESVTAAAFDGSTLELAFPPGRKFAVGKVQSKEDELREVFAEVFGISPHIVCAARDDVPGLAVADSDDEPPASREDVVARLKAELGAEVEE
ncbi:MAG TPA: hypothetical protein VF660_12025, partial [Actinomycetota bacterium]